MEKLFLTRREMANILNLSISSVNRGYKAKRPPFHEAIRIGRRVLFPVSSLTTLQGRNRNVEEKNEQ